MPVKEIEVLEKGQYDRFVNAYMIGMSSERKIVLYDNLVNNYSHNQILAVLAHEMGHYEEEHMAIGLTLGALSLLIVLPLLKLLTRKIFEIDIKDLANPVNHGIFILIISVLMFIANPIENSISRYIEKRADEYALDLTKDSETVIEMKRKMAKDNKSHLMQHPVYVWFYHSHPTTLERIRMAEKFKR